MRLGAPSFDLAGAAVAARPGGVRGALVPEVGLDIPDERVVRGGGVEFDPPDPVLPVLLVVLLSFALGIAVPVSRNMLDRFSRAILNLSRILADAEGTSLSILTWARLTKSP